MAKPTTNPCIRCGQERILVKTWNEQVGLARITYTTSVCPNPQCQKIVDRENAARKEKKEALMRKHQLVIAQRTKHVNHK